jgi:hypothetical protein
MKTKFFYFWSVWSQFISSSALNLFQLARLFPEQQPLYGSLSQKREASVIDLNVGPARRKGVS